MQIGFFLFYPFVKYGRKIFINGLKTCDSQSFQSRCITNLLILAPNGNRNNFLPEMNGLSRSFKTATGNDTCAMYQALIE